MRPASPKRDFQQPQQPCLGRSKPSCCICSLPQTTLCGQQLGRHCYWLSDWALVVTQMAQCTDLPCVVGEKAIRNAEGNPIVSQEKHVVPAQWGCSSLCTSGLKTSHLHLQRSLDWTRQDNGLASQVTGPHTTITPWCTHHQLILKKILLPYCWGSSSHRATTWHF